MQTILQLPTNSCVQHQPLGKHTEFQIRIKTRIIQHRKTHLRTEAAWNVKGTIYVERV